jgi:hypothetical protein
MFCFRLPEEKEKQSTFYYYLLLQLSWPLFLQIVAIILNHVIISYSGKKRETGVGLALAFTK